MAKKNVIALVAQFVIDDVLKNTKKYQQEMTKITKETQKTATAVSGATKNMTDSFEDFVQKISSAENVTGNFFAQLENLLKIWNKADQPPIDIDKFAEEARKGASAADSFASAIGQMTKEQIELKKETEITIGSVKDLSLAILGSAAAFTVIKKVIQEYVEFIKEAIESYTDLAEATRQIQFITGLATEEASAWAKIAELQGTSARSLAAGFVIASRNLTNLQLAEAAGNTINTNFARTLRKMKIDLVDTSGEFKDFSTVLSEIIPFVRSLGVGQEATAVVTNIFGARAKAMIPIMLDTSLSIEEVMESMTGLGAIMTELDKKQYQDLIESERRLNIATQAQANIIGREWIPIITLWNNRIADAIIWLNELDIVLRALSETGRSLLPRSRIEIFLEAIRDESDLTSKSLSFTTKALLVLKAVEEAFRGEVAEPTSLTEVYKNKLDELKGITEEATKVEDDLAESRRAAIRELFAEADAAENLEDKIAGLIKRGEELQITFEERLEDVGIRFNRRWADIVVDRLNDQIVRSIKAWNDIRELYIKHQQKLEDITRKESVKQKDLQDDLNKKLERFDEDARLKREKLESQHRLRLFKIQTRFLDTVQDAARRNDAVAVVQAMRQRARSTRDETETHRVNRQNLEKDLKVRRRRIEEDAKERQDDAKKGFDDQRARADIEYKRQLEALKRKNDEEDILLRLKYAKQKADFDRDKARAEADTQRWYDREKAALERQLADLGVIAVTGIRKVGADIAAETAMMIEGMTRSAIPPIVAATALGRALEGMISIATRNIADQSQADIININRRPRITPRGTTFSRGEGGIDVINSPTTFRAGEKGGEVHAFIPLRHITTVRHQFSDMGVNFGGLPGGMNTSQMESMIYGAMVRVVEQLEGVI